MDERQEDKRGKSANPDLLRQKLDEGVGHDKVSYPDPAAAPLGTDDEASGHPITPEQLAVAQSHETRGAPQPAEAEPAWAVPRRRVAGRFVLPVVVALGLLGLLILLMT